MTRDSAIAYLLSGLLRTDTCWVWLGPRQKAAGYSGVTINGRWTYLHRLSYEHHVGPIPAGLVIDHLCRRPYCMNPEHLEPVTNAENLRRGVWPARDTTHCQHGHEMTPDNVQIEKTGRRRCRKCLGRQGYGRGGRGRLQEKCKRGHSLAEHGYVRPDGRGRQCLKCGAELRRARAAA